MRTTVLNEAQFTCGWMEIQLAHCMAQFGERITLLNGCPGGET